MKKILFVFTGGTIGSTVKGNYISTDSNKPYLLIKGYEERYGEINNYDTLSPYTVLSENMNEEYLSKLLFTVQNNIDKYDGIIITHGTDTLAYSSAILGYAFGKCKIPVCLVSANYPLEDNRSNGYINLYGAIRFIETVGNGGVWVSYKNEGEKLKMHNGVRLISHAPFSDNVKSVKDIYYGSFSENGSFEKNKKYSELPDEINPMLSDFTEDENELCKKLKKGFSRIQRIVPYPGMVYPTIPENVKYILHESYHSGTIDTASKSAVDFYNNAKNKRVRIFLTGVENRIAYESVKAFDELGIIPIFDISPLGALAKLQLISSLERDVESEIPKRLSDDF